MKPSTQKLVAALEAENSPKLKRMIRLAKEGYYHDFDSDLDFPTTTLYYDLRSYGFESLALRVANGEFDASKDEAEEWTNSFEGMLAFDDSATTEQAKEVAKAISASQGIPWDEVAWNEMIKSKRLSN